MIGQQIRGERHKQGLNQSQLAVAAGIGEATLRRAETGRHRTTTATLTRIADALGIPLDDLISHDREPDTASSSHGTNQPRPALASVKGSGPSRGE